MNPLLPAAVQRGLILASASPRRSAILRALQFEFRVVPADDGTEDAVSASDPYAEAAASARLKARNVARRVAGAVVIGADTVVVLDGTSLGKPADDSEARRFLRALSGREHVVATGVVISKAGGEVEGIERTRVRFRDLTDAEIDAYVSTGECRDKAGGYAVQGLGAPLVRSISGCYYNVVGLPVGLLFDLLKSA